MKYVDMMGGEKCSKMITRTKSCKDGPHSSSIYDLKEH